MTGIAPRLGLALGLSLLTATAHADVDGLIKYRQALMRAIAAHTEAAGLLLDGQAPLHDDVGIHAAAIATLAAGMDHLFPRGSGDGKTAASGDIWEHNTDFIDKSINLSKAADAFDEMPDAEHLAALRKTCDACHKTYKSR